MSFEGDLKTELAAVTAIANKIYPLTAPEGTQAPYLVYISSEGLPDKSLDGYLTSKRVSCELNIVGANYAAMKSLTASVLEIIRSFQGRTIGISGPFIQDVSLEEPVELYESQVKMYRCNTDVKFYF